MKSEVILICLLLCPNAHAFERKDLVGTWELISYVLTEDGTEKPSEVAFWIPEHGDVASLGILP
jgi:hypothetical protein